MKTWLTEDKYLQIKKGLSESRTIKEEALKWKRYKWILCYGKLIEISENYNEFLMFLKEYNRVYPRSSCWKKLLTKVSPSRRVSLEKTLRERGLYV